MNIICIAQTMQEQTLTGRYGPFEAVTISGDTYHIHQDLNRLGFRWWKSKRLWYMPKKQFSSAIQERLNEILGRGGDPSAVGSMPPPTPAAAPETPPRPSRWVSDNPDRSKWYGFPINRNIRRFDVDFELDGVAHREGVRVDRSFVPGTRGPDGRVRNSVRYKGVPRYRLHIGISQIRSVQEEADPPPIVSTSTLAPAHWEKYDEEQFLDTLPAITLNTIQSATSASRALRNEYDMRQRTPELKQFLIDQSQKESQGKPTAGYELHLDESFGDYQGAHPVVLRAASFTDADQAGYQDHVWLNIAIDHPLAPSSYCPYMVDLRNVHTVEELQQRIQEYLQSDSSKQRYLQHLKSFAFLPHQEQRERSKLAEVERFFSGGGDLENAVRKLIEKGYIRANRRQRQGPGMVRTENIDWIVDSRKIVDDTYGGGYLSATPGYFYTVLAYYIHRKVRRIQSWTDSMLLDSMRQWATVMRRFGSSVSSIPWDEVEQIIAQLGDRILQYIHQTGEATSAPPGDSAIAGDPAVQELSRFAEQFGVDPANLRENIRTVYRALARKIHPDTAQDPREKSVKEEQFKELQAIWDRMPSQLKQSRTWYERSRMRFGQDSTAPAEAQSATDDWYERAEQWHEEVDSTMDAVLQEYKHRRQQKHQPWQVVPAARVAKIWADYARLGFVRDEKGMQQIADRMVENAKRLWCNTVLCGHTSHDYAEYLERNDIPKNEQWDRTTDDWFLDCQSGQWRISDHGLEPLMELACRLHNENNAEKQLLLADRMFQITHPRSDLAGSFIEGGRSTLQRLFLAGTKEKPESYSAGQWWLRDLRHGTTIEAAEKAATFVRRHHDFQLMSGTVLSGLDTRYAGRRHYWAERRFMVVCPYAGTIDKNIFYEKAHVQNARKEPPPDAMASSLPPTTASLKRHAAPDDGLIQAAKDHFGTTEVFEEAGYILPDGSMLDLSGRHYASGYRNKKPMRNQPDYLAFERNVDHRELDELSEKGGTQGMHQFMAKTGAIRFAMHSGDVVAASWMAPLTEAQRRRLLQSTKRSSHVVLDVLDASGQTIRSLTRPLPRTLDVLAFLQAV